MIKHILPILIICNLITAIGFMDDKHIPKNQQLIEPNNFQANFYYLPVLAYKDQEIKFYNLSTGNPDSFLWNFGDGATSQKSNPAHKYLKPAIYMVTLYIIKGKLVSRLSKMILIRGDSTEKSGDNSGLKADFRYEPDSPQVGVPVKFYDLSSGQPIKKIWQFNFFDLSFLDNPVRTFYEEGNYAVSLTVKDLERTDKITKYLTVGPPPPQLRVAKSCFFDDVQEAIRNAKAGDTVVVPAGSATWNSNLVINKGIILKGMGVDKTVITCNYDGTGESMNSGGYFISYEPGSPAEDQPFRLTGFTFNLNSKSNTGGLLLKNKSNYYQTKVRIDHTKWVGVNAKRAIWWIYGYFWGVGDNNYFDTPGNFRFYGLDSTTWANETFNYGTANNFYLEDNYFRLTNDDYFYLEGAGRLALRYNTIYCDVRTGGYYPVVDVHGNQASAWSGAMGFEGYGNQIYASYSMRVIDGRAGRILFYNNSITQSSGYSSIAMREEEYDSNNPPAQAPDGQPQHVSDSYVFNNYRNGTLLTLDFPYTGSQLYYSAEGCNVPTEGIHYWKHNSSFDGTSGVGVGLLSKRPSSASKDGVAWWATDVNNLYRWKNGKWELYYTPFAYPHPIRAILQD